MIANKWNPLQMLKAFLSIVRFIWPYVREYLFRNGGADPNNEQNRSINILIGMFVAMFAVTLFLVDHGIGMYKHFSGQLNEVSIRLDRADRLADLTKNTQEEITSLRARANQTEDRLRMTNRLLTKALSKLPPEVAAEILGEELTNVRSPSARRDIWNFINEVAEDGGGSTDPPPGRPSITLPRRRTGE